MSETARRSSPNSRVRERLRIVIADDHEPTRVLLRTLLELEAIHVVGEAEDGRAAIALALEHEPDVVLLDVNMPGLDGLSAAEIIRTRRPQIRLLLHTGEPLDKTLARAAALHLPLTDKRDLHKTIERLAQTGVPEASANSAATTRTERHDRGAEGAPRRARGGWDVAVERVAKQLGHRKSSFTLDTYAHLFERARPAAELRDSLEQRFGHLLADENAMSTSGRNKPQARLRKLAQ